MQQALLLLALLTAGIGAGLYTGGFTPVFQITFGALTLMGALIAGIFFWLWTQRATPLSLGMAFAWTGTALVIGWEWARDVLGQPAWMEQSAYLPLAMGLYLCGAALHFEAIETSFRWPRRSFLIPAAAAIAASVAVHVLAG